MGRVIHFEIPVDEPQRAQKFYGNVFGWYISSWGVPADYWLATTGPEGSPGINGALTRRTGTWAWVHVGVDSVDEALRKLREAGGEIVTPKMPIPGIGYMAYCRDSEGNAIGIFEEDPTAQP